MQCQAVWYKKTNKYQQHDLSLDYFYGKLSCKSRVSCPPSINCVLLKVQVVTICHVVYRYVLHQDLIIWMERKMVELRDMLFKVFK